MACSCVVRDILALSGWPETARCRNQSAFSYMFAVPLVRAVGPRLHRFICRETGRLERNVPEAIPACFSGTASNTIRVALSCPLSWPSSSTNRRDRTECACGNLGTGKEGPDVWKATFVT